MSDKGWLSTTSDGGGIAVRVCVLVCMRRSSQVDDDEDNEPARRGDRRAQRDGQAGFKAPESSQHRAKGLRIGKKRGWLARWCQGSVTGSLKFRQSVSLLSSRSE